MSNQEKKQKGLITVLQIIEYKGGNILIRKLPKNIYEWLIFFKGKFFSSYVVINPVKGQKDLTEAEVSEVIKILYAGAASSIDYQLGVKLSKKEKEVVKMFEEGRNKTRGEA